MTDRSNSKITSESPPKDRHKCVGCSELSPLTETNYTLISAQHGWRLTRGVDATGRKIMEWRCPSCWDKAREKRHTR